MTRRMAANPRAPAYYRASSLTHGDRWSGALTWSPWAMAQAFRRFNHSRKPARWFLGSMTDLFHEHAPRAALEELAAEVHRVAPGQTLILSTKRPGRLLGWQQKYFPDGLPANVWCLLSVCNQHDADRKIPTFLQVRASVRGLQVEPMLEGIDALYAAFDGAESFSAMGGIGWAIIGPETGPGARPYDPAWGLDLARQCSEAGVPVWGKPGSGIERQELPHD